MFKQLLVLEYKRFMRSPLLAGKIAMKVFLLILYLSCLIAITVKISKVTDDAKMLKLASAQEEFWIFFLIMPLQFTLLKAIFVDFQKSDYFYSVLPLKRRYRAFFFNLALILSEADIVCYLLMFPILYIFMLLSVPLALINLSIMLFTIVLGSCVVYIIKEFINTTVNINFIKVIAIIFFMAAAAVLLVLKVIFTNSEYNDLIKFLLILDFALVYVSANHIHLNYQKYPAERKKTSKAVRSGYINSYSLLRTLVKADLYKISRMFVRSDFQFWMTSIITLGIFSALFYFGSAENLSLLILVIPIYLFCDQKIILYILNMLNIDGKHYDLIAVRIPNDKYLYSKVIVFLMLTSGYFIITVLMFPWLNPLTVKIIILNYLYYSFIAGTVYMWASIKYNRSAFDIADIKKNMKRSVHFMQFLLPLIFNFLPAVLSGIFLVAFENEGIIDFERARLEESSSFMYFFYSVIAVSASVIALRKNIIAYFAAMLNENKYEIRKAFNDSEN